MDFCVSTITSKTEEEGRKRKKGEEREVPDPRESIEGTPTINFHQVSSKSHPRKPSYGQKQKRQKKTKIQPPQKKSRTVQNALLLVEANGLG